MGAPAKANVDPVMHQPLALHSLADANFSEQIRRGLLEQTGAHTLLAIFAAARFQHHGLDALEMQQVAEDETGGIGASDADSRAPLLHGTRTAAAIRRPPRLRTRIRPLRP